MGVACILAWKFSFSLHHTTDFTADPSIYIQEETISVNVGDQVIIRSTVTSIFVLVNWYHEGSLINPAIDTRFSVIRDGSFSILTISRVVEALLGRYECVVIAQDRRLVDSVQLLQGG